MSDGPARAEPAAPPCTGCVIESINDGTTWYCETHRGAIASKDTAGLYPHDGCAVEVDPARIKRALEGLLPELAACPAWASWSTAAGARGAPPRARGALTRASSAPELLHASPAPGPY